MKASGCGRPGPCRGPTRSHHRRGTVSEPRSACRLSLLGRQVETVPVAGEPTMTGRMRYNSGIKPRGVAAQTFANMTLQTSLFALLVHKGLIGRDEAAAVVELAVSLTRKKTFVSVIADRPSARRVQRHAEDLLQVALAGALATASAVSDP